MPNLRAHVETWRPYTLWYVGLVGLSGAVLTTTAAPAALAVSWLVPTLGWLGMHYLADHHDRALDAIAKPHRPIPSGRLPAPQALRTGIVLVAAAAALALVAHPAGALLVVAAAAGTFGYQAGKGAGLLGNVVRGALTACAFVFGAVVAGGAVLWPVAAAFWLHDVASNLVGAVRDVGGDREGGCRTVPVRHGVPVTIAISFACYTTALALATMTSPAAAVAGALGLVAFAQLRHADRRSALRAHEWLVLERVVLAAALLVPGTGLLVAACLAGALLLITHVTQQRMRARHEFAEVPDGR